MIARSAPGRLLAECAAATVAAFALTWLAFGPSLNAKFVSDDVNAIVENEWVMDGVDAAGILRNFSWWGSGRSDSAGYRPAATLSFALSRAVSGADPSRFRVVNYVLNAICAGLLFALARTLGLSREASAAAAAIFAVLPIHSEAVIWVVGRSELGAAAGFLVASLACLRYRHGGSAAALAVAAVAVALGMAFKENAITVLAMPAVFLAAQRIDAYGARAAATTEPHRETLRRDAVALVALAGGAAAYLALRWTASAPNVADVASLLDNPLSVVTVPTRLLGALAVFGRYVALFFWPASLSVDYSYDALGIGPGFHANADTFVALAFLAACVWAVWLGRGRRDVAVVGLLMAAASYSIVSNTVFVLGTILGERLFYIPSAGICLALAALSEPWLAGGRRAAMVAAAVCAIVVAAVAVDRHRCLEWLTPVSLFEAAARSGPRSARAHMELASAYGTQGRIDEALPHFTSALAIKPDYPVAAYNQGNTLARAGRFDDAAAAYRHALALDAKFVRAWHNLALVERARGNTAGWVDALESAAAVAPKSAVVESDLGEALLAAGRYEDAVKAYDAVVATGQAVAATYFNRGVARHHLGGCAAAVEDYRLAAAQPAAPREVFVAASRCLQELGRNEEAASIEQAAKVANRDTRR